MPHRAKTFEDPAAEASQFLMRLGLAVLLIAIPVASLFLRRAIFLLFPIGASLILLAAMLTPRRDGWARIRAALLSPMGAVALVLFGWAMLSLIWTPLRSDAAERLAKGAGTLALAAAAAAVLPERMRVANLWLAPIGVGAAAAAALTLAFYEAPYAAGSPVRAATFERALATIALLMWPALAILISRRRPGLAVALPILAAGAAFMADAGEVFVALAAGGLAFAATMGSHLTATRWLARSFAAMVLAAPLAPFLARGFKSVLPSAVVERLAPLVEWGAMISAEPLRLLTGHGLDSAARPPAVGGLPASMPRTALFDIWHELGLVGATAVALLLWGAFRVARRAPAASAPALVGGLTCGLILGSTGGASTQLAWLTGVAVAAVAFTAMANGLYNTSRPAAPAPRNVKAPTLSRPAHS